ncbi:trigger factor [Chroococcidiopsis sp. CCMEE 29]|uniref:trigger factor n=1 Tax=Chroococcidiopsis sp. CCMEE 29 TaxID=155894 RepID=UPI00201FB918|nr:trigger factor [Chroococcidiopsis sp. CCMEE 29]
MKVTQEKLPASQIGLEIEIPPEKSKQSYEQVIQNFARAANIPGFRKGKVPRQILIQQLGVARIKAAALEDLLQSGITEALKQEDIKAIGQPQLRSSFEELVTSFEPGKPLTFTAAVDVQPEVNLSQYSGFQVQAEEVKYDPANVEKVLEENRSEMAALIPVEGRAAQIGDIAVVDFAGLVSEGEGEDQQPQEIPGGQATDFQVELQEGRFIEGFIDGIVGMNPGETKEVSAKFPEDYPQQDLAGKAAVFTVTLKELKEKELPELNDDFAQEVSEFETLEELRSSLESRFKTEAERQTKANKEQALTEELLKQLEVELPETLIEEEVDALLTQTAVQLSRQGIDIKKLFTQEMIPQLRERSRPEAIERLRRSQALREVAKRESLQVEPAAVEARIKELMAEYSGQDVDMNRLQEVVEEELLTEKIMSWLEEHSTIELVPTGSLKPSQEETQEEIVASADENEASDVSTPDNQTDIEPSEAE